MTGSTLNYLLVIYLTGMIFFGLGSWWTFTNHNRYDRTRVIIAEIIAILLWPIFAPIVFVLWLRDRE